MNEQTHEETVLRQLLDETAAALPTGDTDLFAGVSSGARHRRRRRIALLGAAGAVVVLAGGASVATMVTDRQDSTLQVRAGGVDRPCAARLEPLTVSRRPGVEEVIVPESPVSAWVCLYDRTSATGASGSPAGPVLSGSGGLSGSRLSALVASLDAAPKGAVRCVTDAHTVAAVRFVYPSGPDVEVRIGVDTCRTASNGSRDVNATAVTVPALQDTARPTATSNPNR
ncbi:hypothetical protein ACFW1A_31705 [Kitasatospora sp. NPDC058965]|uniref:hypothetical protein n=1 Tax=Kitasatospora sp. NPDC058965 TaxID=3346682 RepID=UPI00367E13E8